MKSFKDLKKIKIVPKNKKKPAPEIEKNLQQEHDSGDEDFFLRAMQGVKPLDSRGRDIAPAGSRKKIAPPEEDNTLDILSKLVNGHIEFDIEYSDEYIQGHVQGINSRTFRRLKSGDLSIQAHLDLHGHNALQARVRLLNFMREHYINNKKCLLLITGRGRNSPLGAPVLRKEVQIWLTQEPLKRVVLAFCSAQPRHGGTGAFYVLLRNYKKTGGKVFWDKFLIDTDES